MMRKHFFRLGCQNKEKKGKTSRHFWKNDLSF